MTTATTTDTEKWVCVGVRDPLTTGSRETAACDRCGIEIRWVHVLSRVGGNGVSQRLSTGGCCAARLVAGYEARGAEKELMNRASRMGRFLKPASWKVSKTNPANVWRDCLMPDVTTRQVTVIEKGGLYGVFVAGPKNGDDNRCPYERWADRKSAIEAAFIIVDGVRDEMKARLVTSS